VLNRPGGPTCCRSDSRDRWRHCHSLVWCFRTNEGSELVVIVTERCRGVQCQGGLGLQRRRGQII
jgi:hypothetical protein